MIKKLEGFFQSRPFYYLAFFSIGYGLCAILADAGFPAFLLVAMWVVILVIDRKKL